MMIATVLLVYFAISVVALVFGPRRGVTAMIYAMLVATSLALTAFALSRLFFPATASTPGPITIILPFGLPWLSAHFRIDPLACFFLIVVNLPAAVTSLFAVSYGTHIPNPRRVTPFYPLFLVAMNGVVVADDAFTFLFFWELMSITSWLMVIFDHRQEESRQAGWVYLIMALFGTMCLLGAFATMASGPGTFDFDSLRVVRLSPWASAVVVVLTLIGAGSKAGLVPLHVWLPLAHPAAPSHVSALMSGVMTKVAVYAIIRMLFDLNADAAWGLGLALMVVGGLTAVLGIMQALFQSDLKRVLAYSTVENLGVIAVALGLAAAFRSRDEQMLSALALVAALYHILNHALIKSLLFMGAGAILHATGERRLDQLGGLLNRLPIVGLCFLVGSAAISALPPLNGFVSEWLIFQSLFRAPSIAQWAMRFGVPVVGVAMALSAALAATCFVRTFGSIFLGRARSAVAANAHDVPWPMRIAMIVPAILSLLLGVVPVTVSKGLALVAEPYAGLRLSSSLLGWPWLSPVSPVGGSYSATVLMAMALGMVGIVVLAVGRWGSRRTRRGIAWDCGHAEAAPMAQYSADSFSQPLRRVFATSLFRASEQVEMPMPDDSGPARIVVAMIDPIWDRAYRLIETVIGRIADQVNRLHFLSVRVYLMLMFSTLVLLLLIVAVRQS